MIIIKKIIMQKTIRDLEKAGTKGISYFKFGLYYLFVPVVVGMGLKTVDFSRFFQSDVL